MPLLTEPSFAIGESVNPYAFNATAEAAASAAPRHAPFPPGWLVSEGRAIYEAALAGIATGRPSALCRAMTAHGCNKSTTHNYTQAYEPLLAPLRAASGVFLEVGIGTNNQDVPSRMGERYQPGASLRGWRAHFGWETQPVFGADIDPRILFEEPGIRTAYINQNNPNAIAACAGTLGFDATGIDAVLDDGLHEFHANVALLLGLWPKLNRHGLHIIEDIAQGTFDSLIGLLRRLALGADWLAIALPSTLKADNRIIILQRR